MTTSIIALNSSFGLHLADIGNEYEDTPKLISASHGKRKQQAD
jgi:hypothetical protein